MHQDDAIEAYPLCWPPGWVRKKYRRTGIFKDRTNHNASCEVITELDRMGATRIIVSSNLVVNKDGSIRSGQRMPGDPGVAVYFLFKDMRQCIPCDQFDRLSDNLRAITLSVQAIRGLERWGGGQIVDAAFSGFKALPAKIPSTWRDVLGVDGTAGLDAAEFQFKVKVKQYHPDRPDGDVDNFNAVCEAIRHAREEYKPKQLTG